MAEGRLVRALFGGGETHLKKLPFSIVIHPRMPNLTVVEGGLDVFCDERLHFAVDVDADVVSVWIVVVFPCVEFDRKAVFEPAVSDACATFSDLVAGCLNHKEQSIRTLDFVCFVDLAAWFVDAK